MEQHSDYQEEYREELKKVHDRDFAYNWVSSSAFIFYLSVFCLLGFFLGSCFMLYEKRFDQPQVNVQESTKYVPQYK